MSGIVEAIHTSPRKSVLPRPVPEVAVTEQGVVGDRYGEAGDVTLVEAEALEALAEETGIELTAAEVRRQVLTRGVRLNDLLGKRFRVGEVLCHGEEWCEPCNHLQSLTKPGVLKGLVHRGGLRAQIVEGGRIAVGDAVTADGA
jgi:MOSC domain-containing protein YiiM